MFCASYSRSAKSVGTNCNGSGMKRKRKSVPCRKSLGKLSMRTKRYRLLRRVSGEQFDMNGSAGKS